MADLQPGTEGFIVVDHYPTLQRLTLDPPGPQLSVNTAIGRGFYQDHYTGYRAPCLIRDLDEMEQRSEAGLMDRVTFIHDPGERYHLGFVLQDSDGDEIFAVNVGHEEVGRIAAVRGDMRPYLYVSEEPHRLGRSRPVNLVPLTKEGAYRIEGMLLLPELPKVPAGSLPQVRDLDARPAWMLPGRPDFDRKGSADTLITWWTDRVSRCQVRIGRDGGALEALAGGESEAISHRLVVKQLERGQRYRVEIRGETDRGEPLAPAEISFVAGRPPDTTERQEPAAGAAETTISVRRAGDPGAETGLPWPLTFGCPFPKGAVFDPSQVELADDKGDAVPFQSSVTARWPDGSIRWLLTDLQADPAASNFWNLRPRRGEGAPPVRDSGGSTASVPQVQVTEDRQAVTIQTGAIGLRVPRFGPGIISQVEVMEDGREQPLSMYGLEATVVRADGQTFTAAAPDRVTVEAQGPLRATVHIVGGYLNADGQRLGTFHCRIHAYAGLPWLRLSWTFENDWTRDELVALRSMHLELATSFHPPHTARLGTGAGVEEVGGGTLHLKQIHEDAYEGNVIEEGQRRPLRGSQAPGWAELVTETAAAGLAVEDFWQRYPKGLTVSPDGISLALLPELPDDAYDQRREGDAAHRLYYHVQGGMYHLRQGVSFTQDLMLSFTPGGSSPRVQELAHVLADPPVAVLPSSYYEETGAWFWFAETRGPAGQAYDEAADKYLKIIEKERREQRKYGFLNYGDWWGERRINWGNCEYDTARGLLTQFMRSGDPRFLHLGRQAEVHHRDVDTVHHHAEARRVGAVCAHAIGHTGGYYEEGELDAAGGNYEPWDTISHTWVEGHLLGYFLTGDRRALEVALKVGRRYAGQELAGLKFENCRNPGWHLILTSAMYHATLDPFFLNSSRYIVGQMLERQTPDGGWKRQLRPGHCHCMPRCRGNAGFMVGVLLYGLYAYYQTTGDPAVPPAMVRAGHYLLDEMFLDEPVTFRYTSCRQSKRTMRVDFRPTGGLALGYRVSGDERLADLLLRISREHLSGDRNSLSDSEEELARVGATVKGISVTMWFAPPVVSAMDEIIASRV